MIPRYTCTSTTSNPCINTRVSLATNQVRKYTLLLLVLYPVPILVDILCMYNICNTRGTGTGIGTRRCMVKYRVIVGLLI